MWYTFITLNFLVAFFSDLLLNIVSRSSYAPPSIKALYPYFKHYNSALLTAFYAGITVDIVLLITMLLSFLIFGFFEPVALKQLLKFIVLAFPIGYVADLLIYRFKLFGNQLDAFYRSAGAGFWGATSFIFSILISYFLIKFI